MVQCKCVSFLALFHQSVIQNILSSFFKFIVDWFGHIASCSMCQCVQLTAPVCTPVFHFPHSLAFVRVQLKQLTPVQFSKPLQQNMFTTVSIYSISQTVNRIDLTDGDSTLTEVSLSCITTSCPRLHLFVVMEAVAMAPGDRSKYGMPCQVL